MYSLSRGVTVACLIGSAHSLGWLLAADVPSPLAIAVLIVSSAAVAGAELWGRLAGTESKTRAALLSLFAILLVAVSGGSVLAHRIAVAATVRMVLLVVPGMIEPGPFDTGGDSGGRGPLDLRLRMGSTNAHRAWDRVFPPDLRGFGGTCWSEF
jgi:hypothetical protein